MSITSRAGVGIASKRQAEVLHFISKFERNRSHSPSLTEIAKHFSVSVPTIHQHITYLKGKGLITGQKGKRRSLSTLKKIDNHVTIPLMGLIAAGGPIEAIRDPRPIEVPQDMLSAGGNHFALKVAGESMIEDGICDGDIVIVKAQTTVDDGDKAVVYLPERDAVTLKRIYRENGRVRLVPANRAMQPFYQTNVEIQGKVMGILRKEI